MRRTNLELLGNRLKKEHAKFNDGRSDFEIGCTNATVEPSKIKEVLVNKERIFKGKYLIVLPEEHLWLLEWDGQDHHTRKLLLQGADAIFSSNHRTIRWARGEGDLSHEQLRTEFKGPKPCLHGSDGHKLDDIGRAAGNRYCWIKAAPTFEGLKQILYEPSERIFIGDQPPKLKNDYQIVRSIKVIGAAGWFNAEDVPLNQELVAIIGPRGSGKSALAEMLAFAGGADVFREPKDLYDSFLFKASKKSAANQTPITGAGIEIVWRDGHVDHATIAADLRHRIEEEKVKYLPQRFVERLCAPENTRQLEEEIERVIFQRIDKPQRMEASSFEDLRQSSTGALALKRSKLARTIRSLNQEIADTAARIALKPAKDAELRRKRGELETLLKNVPQVPEQSKEELASLDDLTKRKQELEERIGHDAEQLNFLETIETKYEVLEEDLRTFNQEIAELLGKVGLDGEAVSFIVQMPGDIRAILARRRQQIAADVEALRTGSGDAAGGVNLASVAQAIEEIKARSQLTDAKRKQFEKFQRDRKQLEDSITSLEREIKEIDEVLTPRHLQDNETRIERYLDSFELLKEERAILERLYEPLRTALLASNETARKLTFVSRMTLAVMRHATRGMELLDRRKSTYRDDDELRGALRSFFERIRDADFDREKTKEAITAFRDSFLVQGDRRVKIEDQLRKDWTPREFADWFYGIEDFSVTYSIKFDGKDLELLSPGEKGVVLLLLYLEAENSDNRPLIIDQPDDNLDNVSVYPSLVEYFRTRKKTRQIIIITHNPNLVVNTDAEQIFVANFDGSRTPKITYRSGALEDTDPAGPLFGIREEVCRVLEGGTRAFQLREQRYALS